jgi:2-isopropylmalate synthase
MGYECVRPEKMKQLTELSRYTSQVANIAPLNQRPFVGKSAFAHKAGVHVSAIIKNPLAYEHVNPETVGNRRRVLVSDLSGKSNIEYKSEEMDIQLNGSGADSRKIVQEIKRLEDQGYQFDAAEGSLALLIKKATGQFKSPFVLESFRVTIDKNRTRPSGSQATIKIAVGEETEITAAEGDGPVNALDHALRKALNKFFPEIEEVGLVDYKVRVIDGSDGTGAKVRVQIESRDPNEIWTTIGVSENIIEASWQALVDSVQYKLLKELNETQNMLTNKNGDRGKHAAGTLDKRNLRRVLNG